MNTAHLNPFLMDFSKLPKKTNLIRENGLFTFLLHLKAEEEMPEHHVRGALTVHCLQGRVLFTAGQEDTELLSGSLVSLPGGVPHSLIARTGSLLLVSVCEPITERR